MKTWYLFAIFAITLSGSAGAEYMENLQQSQELPYQRKIRGGSGCTDDSRIRSSPAMMRALRMVHQKTGVKPQLTSCYRSAERQAQVRRSMSCRGRRCRGRVAPAASQHTIGVAADIVVSGYSKHQMCRLLAQVRDELGHGGVGGYPHHDAGHLDLRPGKCAWAVCREVAGGCPSEYVSPVVEQYMTSNDTRNPRVR